MSLRLAFAYPGNLQLRTGGYGYDRQIIAGLNKLGWEIDLIALGDGFPAPSPEVMKQAEARLSALPDDTLVMIDGLAFGILDAWAEREAGRLKIVALVHHPLALETGVSEADQSRLRQSEKRALDATRHVIVTSPMTARELAQNFAVPDASITVAVPGTAQPSTKRSRQNQVPHILSVGSLTKRKGHDILMEALKKISDLSWYATIIGNPTLDPETTNTLTKLLARLGLAERVTLAGECDNLEAAYATSDIFALASRYEGYGMVFAEALSYGLPVIACRTGAVPDVVPAEAGFLVPVDDVDAMASALRTLLSDPAERARRAEAAAKAGAELPSWVDTSSIISNKLKELI